MCAPFLVPLFKIPFCPPSMPPGFSRRMLVAACAMLVSGLAPAVPPLVTDDAEVAEKNTFEIYAGYDYQSDGGSLTRQIPAVELNYGLLDRVEVSIEIPYLSVDGT